MKYIKFYQQIPTNHKIIQITYNSCSGDFLCNFVKKNEHGNWWAIHSKDLPTRYICLTKQNAVTKMSTKYGYMDKNDCVNYKTGEYGIISKNEYYKVNTLDSKVVDSISKIFVTGIPQRTVNSGLCWYAAMCFCCFFCKQLRDLIKYYSKDIKLNNLIDTCLLNTKDAETLRHHLYNTYNVGDNPKQSPDLDGQNGFSEFIILCGKLKIPLVRLFAPNLSEFTQNVVDKKNISVNITTPNNNDKYALLVVRCFRTKWRPEICIRHNNRKYVLASVLIGSEHCGHQIGASTCDLQICRWACADADACREGLSPIFWKVKHNKNEKYNDFIEKWWDAWGKMIPVTLFNSSSFCDFSPHNRATCKLESDMKNKTCQQKNAGVVNSDFVYISINEKNK